MERWRVSDGVDNEERISFRRRFKVSDGLKEALAANENIAYLAGASDDVHLGKGGKEGYVFDMESKSKHWLTDIVVPVLKQEQLKAKEVAVKQRTTRPEFRIQIWEQALVKTLRMITDHPGIIRMWEEPQQRAWVRGLADAEGSATRNSENQPQFSIYNQSLEKLKVAGEILEKDGIHFGLYLPKGRDVWQLYISGRENLKRFLEVGPGVTHPEKRSCLLQYFAE